MVENPEFHAIRYEESDCNYDPFKKRVLGAISIGLNAANLHPL
jgi:hypothetical protein